MRKVPIYGNPATMLGSSTFEKNTAFSAALIDNRLPAFWSSLSTAQPAIGLAVETPSKTPTARFWSADVTATTAIHALAPVPVSADSSWQFFAATASTANLIYCNHPFTWSSSNTSLAIRKVGTDTYQHQTHVLMARGPVWDIAATRVTDRSELDHQTHPPLLDKIKVAGEAGYEGIELWAVELYQHVGRGGEISDVEKALADPGLTHEWSN